MINKEIKKNIGLTYPTIVRYFPWCKRTLDRPKVNNGLINDDYAQTPIVLELIMPGQFLIDIKPAMMAGWERPKRVNLLL